MESASGPLPEHVDEAIEPIAKLHASHKRKSSRLQRLVNRTVSLAGRPASFAVLSLLVAGWIVANLAARRFGHAPIDPGPFQWLELACSLAALYMTVLILITQRHDAELDEYRQQLTLQLAILAEQKSAKIIELLREIRKDSPHLADPADDGAKDMARPVNTESLLAALRDIARRE